MLAPATGAMLQTAARRHVRLQAAQPASRPVPRLISLLPLVVRQDGGDGHSADMSIAAPGWEDGGALTIAAALTGKQRPANASTLAMRHQQHGGPSGKGAAWLRSLASAPLAQLFSAWLAAQAAAVGSDQGSPTLLQVGSERNSVSARHTQRSFLSSASHQASTCRHLQACLSPVQDGTVVALQHPETGSSAQFGVQLQRGVQLDEGGDVTVLLRPDDLRPQGSDTAAQCRVEQGSAVALQVLLLRCCAMGSIM